MGDGGGTLLSLKGREMASGASKSHEGTALTILAQKDCRRTLCPVPSATPCPSDLAEETSSPQTSLSGHKGQSFYWAALESGANLR